MAAYIAYAICNYVANTTTPSFEELLEKTELDKFVSRRTLYDMYSSALGV